MIGPADIADAAQYLYRLVTQVASQCLGCRFISIDDGQARTFASKGMRGSKTNARGCARYDDAATLKATVRCIHDF
jgi:hypothetical protein